jgi:putative Holliday junction resolvase
MRTLAVDLGTRRVGIALSDEGGKLATPVDVLQVTSTDQAIDLILPLIQREGVRRIVVGLPLDMDGGVGAAAKSVISWGEKLHDRANLPIVYVDERLSSFAAEQGLIDRKRTGEKITRQQKKQQLDALAAAGFLQEFLDGKLIPVDVHQA